ncbi:MAG: zinc-ribbon domain-containing protein [Candidatus Methanomethylophilaceae archaeon]
MKDRTEGKRSFLDDFRSLSTKQIIGIVASMIIAIVLQAFGFSSQCMGFLIIAVIIYMVPHILGVSSVKVKAVIGVVFIVLSLLVTVTYSGPEKIYANEGKIPADTDYIGNVAYVEEDGNITITMDILTEDFDKDSVLLTYGKVNLVSFTNYALDSDPTEVEITPVKAEGSTLYSLTATVPITQNELTGYLVTFDRIDGDNTETVGVSFMVNHDAPSGDIYTASLNGMWMYTAMVAMMFFLILLFSTLMRRGAEKTRTKMEADGRLYPQGYGRCKECGAMVLPGEVTCRKCGTYIDVPEEMRAHKKDYFVCEECGAEVPKDADVCPKCGAKFDSVENEVQHADGTVDVSEETFECSECGAVVPANATRCPKCGATFDEKDE